MKKKKNLVTLIIIFGVIILAGIIIYSKSSNVEIVPKEIAECIGNNSQLYIQLGCHSCKQQEDLFGGSYKYLSVTDCYYNPQLCNTLGIQGIPTWIINGTKYLDVQSIEKLQNLTGCNNLE